MIHTEYPTFVEESVGLFMRGPRIKYKPDDKFGALTSASVKNYIHVNHNLGVFDASDVIFHRIFPILK